MSDNIQFPFVIKIKDEEDNVINSVREEDIAKTFFVSMADFDVKTLLRLRLVSTEWKDAINSIYGKKLWGEKSLMRAVPESQVSPQIMSFHENRLFGTKRIYRLRRIFWDTN